MTSGGSCSEMNNLPQPAKERRPDIGPLLLFRVFAKRKNEILLQDFTEEKMKGLRKEFSPPRGKRFWRLSFLTYRRKKQAAQSGFLYLFSIDKEKRRWYSTPINIETF